LTVITHAHSNKKIDNRS